MTTKIPKLHATLFRANGTVDAIKPKNRRGRKLSYSQLTEAVGGMIEIVPLPSGKVMIVNEEGKVKGLPHNELATQIWRLEFPPDKFDNTDYVVGNAIFASRALIE